MKTTIIVDNLKCGGCAGSIKKGLLSFPEVSDVIVDNEKDSVEVTYTEENSLNKIKEKLHSMGYPERGTTEGFDKFASNAKSYVSCAIGKLTTEN